MATGELTRSDVLVVGGGIAGVSTAAHVSAHASVTLIEAEEELSRHSTGRSAAAYLPTYGQGAVRALTLASRTNYDAISAREDLDLLIGRPLLWVATDEVGEANIADVRDAPSVRTLTVDEARRYCPPLRPDTTRAALLDIDAADIDVAALHQAYVAELRRHGGQIRRGTRLVSARRNGSGWQVETSAGSLRAGVVVDAAGAWADEVATACGVRSVGVRPMRRTAFITPAPDRFGPTGHWPLVAEAGERWYFRPEGPSRLLVSLSEETPMPPCDVRPDDMDVALAIDRLNDATTLDVRRVDHSWAGLRSFVRDRQPVAGAWPDQPGFVFVAGQGGYGIQLGPALAVVAAHRVLGTPMPAALAPAAQAVLPDRLLA